MGRPRKEDLEWTEEVEDAAALVSRIDHNQRRIAARSRDPDILHEVADTRDAAAGLRRWISRIYPGNEKREE